MTYRLSLSLNIFQVPRNMDAGSIVRVVRKKFYDAHSEYEFYVVMDVHREKEDIVRELQRAQVR